MLIERFRKQIEEKVYTAVGFFVYGYLKARTYIQQKIIDRIVPYRKNADFREQFGDEDW